MSISEPGAKEIMRRLTSRFSVAYDWMNDRQRHAEEVGEAEDYFGRTRKLAAGESYLARNFAVQGVAATFCQEKLIQLHMALRERVDAYLCFTVHDGYVGACTTDTAREVCQTIRSNLESVSELCPGLAVKVRISTGPKLNQLQEILN
jgi:DNA polymerase I-like protein with 3'-5' exonuclease and polymerase domains